MPDSTGLTLIPFGGMALARLLSLPDIGSSPSTVEEIISSNSPDTIAAEVDAVLAADWDETELGTKALPFSARFHTLLSMYMENGIDTATSHFRVHDEEFGRNGCSFAGSRRHSMNILV